MNFIYLDSTSSEICPFISPFTEVALADEIVTPSGAVAFKLIFPYVLFKPIKINTRENIKTAKNSLVESFYDKMGFELFAEDGVIKQYRITLTNADLTFKQLYTIN